MRNFAFSIFFLMASSAYASLASMGEMGINSLGLKLPNGIDLRWPTLDGKIEREGKNMVNRIFALLAFVLCCSLTHAEEVVEIPLSEVWSHMSSRYMLTAKRLADLEPEYFRHQGGYLNSRMFQIQQLLAAEFPPKNNMKPGFVVIGEGRRALEQAYAVLVKGQTTQDSIPQGSSISAIFFTRVIGYMHLMQIQRAGTMITINYCLEPTRSNANVSAKVAIIPLGKLPIGKYQVDIVGFTKKPDDRSSVCEPIIDERRKKLLICQPFEFTIIESVDSETPSSALEGGISH